MINVSIKKRYLRLTLMPLMVAWAMVVLGFLFGQFSQAGKDVGWLFAAMAIILPYWSVWALLVYAHYSLFGRKNARHEDTVL